MPNHRLRRLVRGQGGSTLIELLVAMPLAVLLLGLVTEGLGAAGLSQRDVERRTAALTQAQLGLERMTRELRQAEWLYFRSSSVVDIDALVRPGPTAHSGHRLVRYDCSGIACVRSEGPPVAYPPPPGPVFTTSSVVVGAPAGDATTRYGMVVGHDVFQPTRVDATGRNVPELVDPDAVEVHLRIRVKYRTAPVELVDGVSLRNRSTFR
jgi:type II secretory pathway pseudopilin PulG